MFGTPKGCQNWKCSKEGTFTLIKKYIRLVRYMNVPLMMYWSATIIYDLFIVKYKNKAHKLLAIENVYVSESQSEHEQ